MLHKKRPQLIPVLDNRAIFEAYTSTSWCADRRTSGETVKCDTVGSKAKLSAAIAQVHADLNEPFNRSGWQSLRKIAPSLSRIELLDMVWWEHFRAVEPVAR